MEFRNIIIEWAEEEKNALADSNVHSAFDKGYLCCLITLLNIVREHNRHD